MNTAAMIMFLLLPAFPQFVDSWRDYDAPLDPVILETPLYAPKHMSDKQLQKQIALTKIASDPATRSKIVADIGKSCHKDVFTVLDEMLATEKDPAVRADIIATIAGLPVKEERPGNMPYLEINWKSAHAAEYEKSRNSTYLPEKMAAERFLREKDFLPAEPSGSAITIRQQRLIEMDRSQIQIQQETLKKLLDPENDHLIRMEAIRTLSRQKKLTVEMTNLLEKIAAKAYIVQQKTKVFDNEAVRAAAYMALVCHADEHYVAGVLKNVDQVLDKSSGNQFPLFQEYRRQICLFREGAKDIAPSPLLQRGQSWTFQFTE